jgi:hypothetical protein
LVTEQRKHIRLAAEDDAYAALGTHYDKVGKLLDISIGGLGFRYIDKLEDSAQDSSIVAIFLSKNRFYLPGLACRLIYDSPIQSNNSAPDFKSPFRINRCGLQFTSLTDHQMDKLKFFINHHTLRLKLPY